MKIGSLFTGYGGLDLAVMDIFSADVSWYSEIEPSAMRILRKNFPRSVNIGDVRQYGSCCCNAFIPWDHLRPVDILTAGYPCQPFSQAGKRKGITDDRYLWPAVADAIAGLEPGLVIVENVINHLHLGFEQVLHDLGALGYGARWGVVRASDAGAPHRRARLFLLAANADGAAQLRRIQPELGSRDDAGRRSTRHSQIEWGKFGPAVRRWERILGRPAPQPWTNGIPGRPRMNPKWVEWMMGLPDEWVTGIIYEEDLFGIGSRLSHGDALKMLGNGVVPQQARLALGLLT